MYFSVPEFSCGYLYVYTYAYTSTTVLYGIAICIGQKMAQYHNFTVGHKIYSVVEQTVWSEALGLNLIALV